MTAWLIGATGFLLLSVSLTWFLCRLFSRGKQACAYCGGTDLLDQHDGGSLCLRCGEVW